MNSIIRNKKNLLVIKKNPLVKRLKYLASNSRNKRSRLCAHVTNKENVNEMIIALQKDSYVGPHTHPKIKSESYLILEGSMNVYIFDDSGRVIKNIKMGPYSSGKQFYYRMKNGYWHMPYAHKEWCIYYETFAGPYVDKSSVITPKWAPDVNDQDEINDFLFKNKIK